MRSRRVRQSRRGNTTVKWSGWRGPPLLPFRRDSDGIGSLMMSIGRKARDKCQEGGDHA
jgi:hypothetical protein